MSGSLLRRLHERELGWPRRRPGGQAVALRQFYENIVPSKCVANVEYPSYLCVRKFSSDGKYLVCFNRSLQSVLVYRFCWPTSPHEEIVKERDGRFETYFSLVYERSLATYPEVLCKDFCLLTEGDKFMILASSVPANTSGSGQLAPVADPTRVASAGAREAQVSWVPRMERITFYLVGLADGIEYDRRLFLDDYIVLPHHAGVHLHDDLFGVLSVRYQALHIMHIRETGSLVDVRVVGPHCYDDDELVLACQRDAEAAFNVQMAAGAGPACSASLGPPQHAGPSKQRATHAGQPPHSAAAAGGSHAGPSSGLHALGSVGSGGGSGGSAGGGSGGGGPSGGEGGPGPDPGGGKGSLVTGLKQRILAHLFRECMHPDMPPERRLAMQRAFHCRSGQYESLVLWRFQFLDHDHLLLKLIGPPENPSRAVEAGAHWNAAAFFVVYEVASARVLSFLHNSSDDLFTLYETYQDFFRLRSPLSPTSPALSIGTLSTNAHLREQHRAQKAAYSSSGKITAASFVKRHLSILPCTAQSSCESPYLDPAIFTYDDRLVSHADSFQCRSYQCLEYPVKFLSRRTGAIRFRIHPGPTASRLSPRNKRWLSYLFHPLLPFVISIQHSAIQPSILNLHFRR